MTDDQMEREAFEAYLDSLPEGMLPNRLAMWLACAAGKNKRIAELKLDALRTEAHRNELYDRVLSLKTDVAVATRRIAELEADRDRLRVLLSCARGGLEAYKSVRAALSSMGGK